MSKFFIFWAHNMNKWNVLDLIKCFWGKKNFPAISSDPQASLLFKGQKLAFFEILKFLKFWSWATSFFKNFFFSIKFHICSLFPVNSFKKEALAKNLWCNLFWVTDFDIFRCFGGKFWIFVEFWITSKNNVEKSSKSPSIPKNRLFWM